MLAATASVLMGKPIWPHLFWAAAGALALAWTWARFQLSRTLAEVRVRPASQQASLQSVRDVLRGADLDWQRVVRLRRERMPRALQIHLGDVAFRLLARDWPRLDAIEQAFHRER